MPITKSLVEKMGGTILFESEQGVGTTFYIELPFQIDHNIKHEELKTKEIKKAARRPLFVCAELSDSFCG